MKILAKYGKDDLATVFVGETSSGKLVEFVQSLQPPLSRSEKWVLIVSTLVGCPVGCPMCDAGGYYHGKLTTQDILEQIEFLIGYYFPSGKVDTKKFKIQFARVGEPAFNENVLEVLEKISHYENLIPSISTIAPLGTDKFFEKLIEVKNKHYLGRFQLQFSIHSTDETQRDKIMPVAKWSLEKIAKYGERFVCSKDRKITLNFAVAKDYKLDPEVIKRFFDPKKFLIKITPVNPTYNAIKNSIVSDVDVLTGMPITHKDFVENLSKAGYEIILSVGELEENKIGSNCGQYVQRHLLEKGKLPEAYSYVG
ncbi:radical SAM protein [Pseudothermotoga thermarum]|uniref:Radical SAM domain protein n=1 Tax=Pseudothermotoga thermarum DSM 5069 TaxID=688269 RepID=F7YUT9_9THEM|nr:radical SAM protein [Pseudothermotoga thermarum]AEH51499.1 Radical SAM domain protein [Pseudothermotoga thermarum DSM 5069]